MVGCVVTTIRAAVGATVATIAVPNCGTTDGVGGRGGPAGKGDAEPKTTGVHPRNTLSTTIESATCNGSGSPSRRLSGDQVSHLTPIVHEVG